MLLRHFAAEECGLLLGVSCGTAPCVTLGQVQQLPEPHRGKQRQLDLLSYFKQ